jgi:hypothetical protein
MQSKVELRSTYSSVSAVILFHSGSMNTNAVDASRLTKISMLCGCSLTARSKIGAISLTLAT